MIATGWYAAAFARQRRLPPLERLLRERRPQTWQEQLEIVRRMHVALGGTVKGRGDAGDHRGAAS